MTHPPAPEIDGFTEAIYLGSGGFADVYQYRHRTGAAYAIKIWREEYAEAAAAQLAIEEAALGRLAGFGTHPNIIAPQPQVATFGRPHLVMELCPDGSLAGRGPMRVADVLRVGIQMCGALETAHLHDVLHCDVKPGNILLARDGTAKLSDFGIAEPVAAGGALGGAMLTPQYAAPEVSDGHTSPSSDVYALAATLHELLTGSPPFRLAGGDNSLQAIDDRKRRDHVAPINRGDVPPELEQLLRLALRCDPAKRSRVARATAEMGPAAVFGTHLREIATRTRDEPTAMVIYHPTRPLDRFGAAAPLPGAMPLETAPIDSRTVHADSRSSASPRPATPEPPATPAAPAVLSARTVDVAEARRRAGDGGAPRIDRTMVREAPAPPPAAAPRRRPWWRVALIVASAIVVAGGVTGVVLAGTDADARPDSSATTLAPTDDAIVDAIVPTPAVTARRLATGAVTFTWTYSPILSGDSYVVTRTDTTAPTPVTVSDRSWTVKSGANERPCVNVIVVRDNGRASDVPGRACAPS